MELSRNSQQLGLQCWKMVLLVAALVFWTNCIGAFLPNLSESCYRCLCYVSTRCDQSHTCTGGYCGPFNISRVYWIDAGKATLPDDDPERNHESAYKFRPGLHFDECECLMQVQGGSRGRVMGVMTPLGLAWKDCARSYHCAKKIIEGYLTRFGKDCNGDGVTDCYDYMMVNGNGGYGCTAPLNMTPNGRSWLARYEECRHSLSPIK